MTTTIFTRENYRKLEAWVLTLAFSIFVVSMLIDSRGTHRFRHYKFEETGVQFNYFENFFIPTIVQGIAIFAALLVAIFVLEPLWERTKSLLYAGLGLLATFIPTFLTIAVADTYTDAWKLGEAKVLQNAYNRIFYDAFVIVIIFTLFYIGYYLLKQCVRLLWERSSVAGDGRPNDLLFKIIAGVAIWFFILLFIGSSTYADLPVVTWGLMVPYSALVIFMNVKWLIPQAEVRSFFHHTYYVRAFLAIILLAFVTSLLFAGMTGHMNGGDTFGAFLLILLWTCVCLLPWSWYLYKNHIDKTKLVTALGRSDANLNFLKSQINPHFLFNALNTLYGTAIQENAERTSEGIQKLGDMMRFMLQENVQDRIALTRDIDYMNNYIDLQKLRISKSADITIETSIEEQPNTLEITPMLLIPFVENAFKHGISLQKPSSIKITLQTRGNTLYFDVYNSIHPKSDNDPEAMKSGIGLPNVKQRLALLYPKKHELIIRESATQFFIHLTIELK